MSLTHSSHSVGETGLHLQFTPAYRRAVFVQPVVRELATAFFTEKARILRVHLAALEFGPDHVHLFVTDYRCVSIDELARQLKGYTSFKLRKFEYLFQDMLWGKKFWSSGYFHRTVGAVNAQTVERYIKEGQKKHWEETSQKTLLNYQTTPRA